MYILLLMLFMAEPRPLTIVVDDNFHSKMIVRDLTYDWSKIDNKVSKRFNEIQLKIKPRVSFIDVTSLDSKVLKYRMDKYPYLIYGERGSQADYLPEQSFMMAGFPLLSIETYLNKIEFDYGEYDRKCIAAEVEASNKYEVWLLKNKPDELKDFIQSFYMDEWYELPGYKEFSAKFANIKGVPVFIPNYPEQPRIWFPWEQKYELYYVNTRYERPTDENRP